MSGPAHVFVYGTLKRGEVQESLVGPGRRAEAHARGRLFRLPAGYPAMTTNGGDLVHGELVDLVDPRTLALLDHYEGVDDGLFRRVELDAIIGLRRVPAWAWVMDDPHLRGGRPVPSGRWTGGRGR